MRDCWLAYAGIIACSVAACGPGKRPPEGCDGPSYDLLVRAEDGTLPADTRLVVRYGSDQEGEPYALGQPGRKQAVFCEEDTEQGGAGGARAERAEAKDGASRSEVWALRCRLYTQGPARVDVSATGYEPVKDRSLSFDDDDRCDVDALVVLSPLPPEGDD
jgi:hypothetical protein